MKTHPSPISGRMPESCKSQARERGRARRDRGRPARIDLEAGKMPTLPWLTTFRHAPPISLALAALLAIISIGTATAKTPDIFDVDYEAIVSEADLIYLSPAGTGKSTTPAKEGQPVGNGRMGTSVRADGSLLRFQINRNDVFGVNKNHSPIASLHNPPRSFGGCGWITVDVGGPAFVPSETFEHRLSVYRAESVVRGQDVQVRCSTLTDRDILAVEIDDQRAQPQPLKLTLATWHEPETRYGNHLTITRFSQTDGAWRLQHAFSEDAFSCKSGLAVLATDAPLKLEAESPQSRVLLLPAKKGKRLLLVSSAATFEPKVEADALASDVLKAVPKADYDSLVGPTRTWWQEFWSRTFVKLHSADGVADYLQRVRTLALYYVGSTSRGDFPTKFNGMLFATEGDRRTWGPQIWVWNTESYYYPTFAADCSDLTDPWFGMFNRNLPSFERAAKQLWGVKEGIFIPETSNFDGCVELPEKTAANMREVLAQKMSPSDLPPGTADDLRFEAILRFYTDTPADHWAYKLSGGRYYWATHILTSAAEIATQAWWRYRYTGDKKFLADQGYPLLRGVADFYLNYCRKEADGLYHVPVGNVHESYWGVRDGLWDLAAIRSVVPAAILAAGILEKDSDKAAKWQEFLDHLTPYVMASDPQAKALLAGTAFADTGADKFPDNAWAPGQLGNGVPGNKNFESAWTAPMFPFDDWSLARDNPADKETATATYRAHMFSKYIVQDGKIGSGHDRITILTARVGLADEVERALPIYAGGQSESMPNGATPGLDKNEESAEHMGNTALALQDAMMQSQPPSSGDQEVILLAPAWPAKWDADFRLLARGGFMVSSRLRSGKPEFAQILSRRGETLRLANPWPDGCLMQAGDAEPAKLTGTKIELPTLAGTRYLFWQDGSPKPETVRITAPRTTEPMLIEFQPPGAIEKRILRFGRGRDLAPVAIKSGKANTQTLVNGSFESQVLSSGGSIQPIEDWVTERPYEGTPSSVEHLAAGKGWTGPTAAQDETNVVLVPGTQLIRQTLAETWKPETTYTLTAYMALAFSPGSSGMIGLAYGGEPLTSPTSLELKNVVESEAFSPEAEWVQFTVTFTTGKSDPFLGQPIVVFAANRVFDGGNNMLFDNFQLTSKSKH